MAERNLISVAERLELFRQRHQPSVADAQALVAIWTTGTAASYFFRRDYSNPGWLQPLAEAGAFRKYARVRSEEGKRWIILRELTAYLHRVATEVEPQQIADILVSLTTEDTWATGQLMKASLALPDKYAAQVVPHFVKWCELDNPFAREEDVIGFARRMLDANHLGEFRLLLELVLKPIRRTQYDVGGLFFDDDLTTFVRDRNDYSEFCQVAPFECLGVAEHSLWQAIRLKARMPDPFAELRKGGKRKEDPSAGMRSAIEEHEQNRYPDFEDGLVVAVRDALAVCVKQSPVKAGEVVDKYLGSDWSIFRRLALHTLKENASTYPEQARSAAVRREFFNDVNLHHEYWHLVRAVFDDLSYDCQSDLLEWINAGYAGADERQRQWFAYLRLDMLKECKRLPDDSRRLLGELADELGPVEHPDFLVYGGSVGSIEPRAPVALEGKDNKEIYEFLKTWQPDPDKPAPFGPSYFGVGEELRRLIQLDADKHLSLVRKMTDGIVSWMADGAARHWATYVGCTLGGYREACREGKAFDWSVLLDLMDKLAPADTPASEWPDALPDRDKDQDWDYDWRSVRYNAINLLAEGIDPEKSGKTPDSQLPRMRDILIHLTRDVFPTPEDEHEYERKNADTPNAAPVDWHHLAINTNRPEAADALIRYAIRYANAIIRKGGGEGRLEPGVRNALDILAIDPCRSVHSALGARLGVLWWLDGDWLKKLLGDLLPMSSQSSDLWEAAWVAFLQFGRLYQNLHQHLIPYYEKSINECTERKEDDPHLKGLCKHLAAVYTWGWEEVSDTGSLINQFYQVARDDAASELADALGRFVRNLEQAGHEAPGQWRRIEALLRWRIKCIAENPEEHVKELRAFAVWFRDIGERGAVGLEAMDEVLKVITSVPLNHWELRGVVNFMDAHAETHPGIAARLLHQMLMACRENRDAWHWERDVINQILDKVFASQSSEAHREGVKIIELLWEEGEWEPFEKHREQLTAL